VPVSTCLSACLLSTYYCFCLPALPACLPLFCLPFYLPACLPACLPLYLPACFCLLSACEQYRLDLLAAYLGLGSCWALTGRLSEAIQAFTSAIELNPQVGGAEGLLSLPPLLTALCWCWW
jgi:hypothetical protein